MGIQFRLLPSPDELPGVELINMALPQAKQFLMYRYMRSYFVIDVISILPYDIVVWLLEQYTGTNISLLRILRVVRLTRLGKILRIVKTSQVIQRLDDLYGFNYAAL